MTELKTPEIIVSSQFPVGMKILHDDPDAVADVCFVHGVTGSRRNAWTAHQQSEPWIKTLLPSHLNKVRILSFGYDPFHGYFQDSRHLHGHASDLLTDIVDYRRQAPLRPLIFITHCIGGLVCQEAINISHASHDEHSANVYFALRGIVSLSMPYLDKYRKAQWEPKGVTRLVQNEHSRDDGFDYNLLRANFFRAMKYRPKTSTPVNITFLFTVVDNGGLPPVASEMFAVSYHVNFEFVPLRAKHADMVKIGSPEDKCFGSIVDRLKEWTAQTALLKQNSAPGSNTSTLASFQTARSTECAQNSHQDHIIRQPEPQLIAPQAS